MKEILPYSEVQVGHIAYENPSAGGKWDNKEGEIVWKGTVDELLTSRYKSLINDWDTDGFDEDAISLARMYDLVVVASTEYGHALFNYNNDPCGVVVFKQ